MLTPEVTKALLPPTGEVRPKIGLTAQTGAWIASGNAGRVRLIQESRRGDGQCEQLWQVGPPDGRMGRLSGECRSSGEILTVGPPS